MQPVVNGESMNLPRILSAEPPRGWIVHRLRPAHISEGKNGAEQNVTALKGLSSVSSSELLAEHGIDEIAKRLSMAAVDGPREPQYDFDFRPDFLLAKSSNQRYNLAT